jgi:DNA/RNA endonuclease YhcR with UshA esterase domain
MTNSRDLILKLKEVKEEKGLSYSDIIDLMEKNNDYLSKATLSRVFADGSEEIKFRYEDTLRPIANALLDMENIEDGDDVTVQGLKTVLKYKIQIIEDQEKQIASLQAELDKQKIRAAEKLDKERQDFQKSIEFLKEQVSLKDKRMDLLLNAVSEKDTLHKEMLEKILRCSKCEKYEG